MKIDEKELNNFDSVDNIFSLQVIEYELEKVKEEIENNEENRMPKHLKDRLIKLKTKRKMIENLITDSKMQDKYLEKIKNQLIVDTRVFHYFIENYDEKNADIIKKRIEIASDEIKELEELLGQKM